MQKNVSIFSQTDRTFNIYEDKHAMPHNTEKPST